MAVKKQRLSNKRRPPIEVATDRTQTHAQIQRYADTPTLKDTRIRTNTLTRARIHAQVYNVNFLKTIASTFTDECVKQMDERERVT